MRVLDKDIEEVYEMIIPYIDWNSSEFENIVSVDKPQIIQDILQTLQSRPITSDEIVKELNEWSDKKTLFFVFDIDEVNNGINYKYDVDKMWRPLVMMIDVEIEFEFSLPLPLAHKITTFFMQKASE